MEKKNYVACPFKAGGYCKEECPKAFLLIDPNAPIATKMNMISNPDLALKCDCLSEPVN